MSNERLKLLQQGLIASNNLMEALQIDFAQLLINVFPDDASFYATLKPPRGIVARMQYYSTAILQYHDNKIPKFLFKHPSDTVRALVCYMLAQKNSWPKLLTELKIFADDSHFGVREWAWLAVRDKVVAEPLKSLQLLSPWLQEDSERLRRFAIELTRPRGVWCQHIPLFKQSPQLAEDFLSYLLAEPALYVQKSLGNWLNDAAKTNSQWVVQLCTTWRQKTSNLIATNKICKRAMRNI